MPKVRKLILVTAKHHPLHKYFVKLAERLAKEFSLDLEIREEDYVYLIKYGDTDEFGMAWVPQLLAEAEEGSIIKVLTKVSLDSQGRLQEDEDYKKAVSVLKNGGS